MSNSRDLANEWRDEFIKAATKRLEENVQNQSSASFYVSQQRVLTRSNLIRPVYPDSQRPNYLVASLINQALSSVAIK